MNRALPDIFVTTSDLERLERLLRSSFATEPVASQLRAELDRAEVVEPEDIPPDVVTMGSRVVVVDDEGQRRELALVWPAEASIDAGRISVLAPIGAALLGLRVGQSIDWPVPSGRTRRLRVEEVLQPAPG